MKALQNKKAQGAGTLVVLVIVLILLGVLFFVLLFNSPKDSETATVTVSEDNMEDEELLDSFFTLSQNAQNLGCLFTVGEDGDRDGIIDACDNCPMDYNPEQFDRDKDNRGDVCDVNDRGDGGTSHEDDGECSENSDCGTNEFVGDNFCTGKNVTRNYITFTCNNPGDEDSTCSNQTTVKVVEECDFSCNSGSCVGEIVCSCDEDCGEDTPETPYCVNDNIYRTLQQFLCVNPGLPNSYCSSETISQFIGACQYACNDGICVRCDSNSDCDDSNSNTQDVCLYPDTASSYCQNTPVGECIFGQTRPCGITEVGECSFGTETCLSNLHWGTCVGAVNPVNEVCDGKDNDCDGLTDEGEVCGPQCTNECGPGERQCYSGGFRTCGNYDADSCTEWSGVNLCGTGEICSNGYCSSSCTNECSFGERGCFLDGWRLCGYFDSDSCTDWSGVTTCGDIKTCQSGFCI